MFYYPAVLKRHSGCFSTIWLVATKGIKVPRRDFLKVNVKRTCEDIMNYVLERVPPPQSGLPRPRFSLYLSSQLQYGVVVVYHRQCAILLEELQVIMGQLLKQRSSQSIDMDDHSRQASVLPDALSLLEETEGASDPLFGVMQLQDSMSSPSAFIQMSREYLRKASPEFPELESPPAQEAADLETGITASPDTITLRETGPASIPAAEFEGEDLIDHLPQTIDFLLDQADYFSELPRQAETPGEQERELLREARDQEGERTKDLTGSTIELQPATVTSEDAMLLPQEELGPPVEMPRPPRDQLTPVSVPGLPSPPPPERQRERRLRSPESEDVPEEVKVKKRRRRKQLIFFDPETQLSEEEVRQQIQNPLTETRPLLVPPLSSHRIVPAPELLNNPCRSLPDEIQHLWRKAATIAPIPGSDLQVGERGPESTDSEKETEREMMEVPEREEQRLEPSPEEVQREMVEPQMFDVSAPGLLLLEISDQKEASRDISPTYISEKEGSTVSRSVSTLQDIPEVVNDLMEETEAGSPGFLPELMEQEGESVLFQSILPPEADRRAVSNIFQRLLENLSARRVRAEQDQPYGAIMIFPGSRYEEAL